jgi:hypothetical protein
LTKRIFHHGYLRIDFFQPPYNGTILHFFRVAAMVRSEFEDIFFKSLHTHRKSVTKQKWSPHYHPHPHPHPQDQYGFVD